MADNDDLLDAAALDAAADKLDEAGESRHSARAYAGDVKHYEHEFGGTFPATPDDIRRYIAKYSKTLNPRTIQRRLSSIAKFHRLHGYPDPVHNDRVRTTMRGLRTEFNRPAKRARPLTIALLSQFVNQWDAIIRTAATAPQDDRQARHRALKAIRAKALFLLGFWLGMRADELVRLDVRFCVPDREGDRWTLKVFLPSSKGDRAAAGSEWTMPKLPLYCPLDAYLDWLHASGITYGTVFCKIHRWAHVVPEGLHVNSVFTMMQDALRDVGLEDNEIEGFSSHSLRRGFATEFTRHGGGLKELMDWVKWKSTDNALRYIEASGDAPLSLMTEWLRSQGVDVPHTPTPLPKPPPITHFKQTLPKISLVNVVPIFQNGAPTPRRQAPSDEDDFPNDIRKIADRYEADFNAEKSRTSRKKNNAPSKSTTGRQLANNDENVGDITSPVRWRIKVELLDVRPVVWRRVDVDPAITIEQLHNIVQAAMGWENFHLWEMGVDPSQKLCDVADIGTEFGYLYDFGDEWQHIIVIEKTVAKKEESPYPKCVGGANACPPEDCGGPHGYIEFLNIVQGPDTYEREELLEVYDGNFNPKQFDIDEANQNLKYLIDDNMEN